MLQRLKYARIFISGCVLIIVILAFLGMPGFIPNRFFVNFLTFLQFIPSSLKFFSVLSFAAFGFIIVFILSLLFGRIYCSLICPLGIFQDVLSRIGKRFRKRKIFRYSKPHNYLRYGILLITVLSLFTGSIFLLNLLDPYSNFGKIWSGLFRPVVISGNDILAHITEKAGIYWLYPVGLKALFWQSLIFPFLFFITVLIMSVGKGRLFCNTICPVGSFLALVSKTSIFKIKISENNCTHCGKCSVVCKASCIDIKIKSVDFSRCVGCFNCIHSCPESAINYKISFLKISSNKNIEPAKELSFKNNSGNEIINKNDESLITEKIQVDRRNFLGRILFFAAGSGFIYNKISAARIIPGNKSGKYNIKRNYPVTPPGSYSIENFNKHCTACHLCVSICPTQVLQPSFLQYGITGFLQPYMDFTHSFCNYECTKCSEICPTNSIIKLTVEKKKAVQPGKVIFVKKNCVVYADETACGACSEHCPTKAVHMMHYKGTLTIPEINQSICVGCGACEYACPAKPFKAIFVDGNPMHLTAFSSKDKKVKASTIEDFPF